MLEEERQRRENGRLNREKEEGRAKSNKMKVGSPLLFSFRNFLSLKVLGINTKKHLNIRFRAWGLVRPKDISPREHLKGENQLL